MSLDAELPPTTYPDSVQPGIPRLGNTPSGWRRVRLRDVLELVQRPVKMDAESEYRLLTVKRSRGGIVERERLCGREISVKSQFRVEGRDFLISKRQIVHGACAIVPDEFAGSIVSNEYAIVRCRNGLSLNYLRHLSHSIYFQQTCFHSCIGVHIEKMIFRVEEWLDREFNLPPIERQHEVAASLDALDQKIVLLGEKRSALERFKTGTMDCLFRQTIRFRRDNGTEFPAWQTRKLHEFGDRPKERNKGFHITRVLTNSATKGVIDQGEYFDKSIANSANIDTYHIVRTGDFVYNPRISAFAPVGPIGRNDLGDGVMSPLYTVFRLREGNSDFFRQYFMSDLWHDYLKSIANYGARHDRMAIAAVNFMSMPLPFPHLDEQARISSALSSLDKKIDAVTAQIAQMELFRRGLIQRLFL